MRELVETILGATLAATVSLFCTSGVASAAVVSGSADDPRGDVPHIAEEYHPRDLRFFGVTYDDQVGVLQATVTHWDPHTYEAGYLGDHFFAAGADVGVARPDGSCDTTSSGSVRTRMTTPTDYTEPGYWASGTVVGDDSIIYGDIGGAVLANRWTYTLTSPALMGRGYDCVANIWVLHHGTETVDTGVSFCMGPSGTVPCAQDPTFFNQLAAAPGGVAWRLPPSAR